MLKIDRERVRQSFKEYTSRYDTTDQKTLLKIQHTYRVAALCERIAKSENMTKEEVDLAWLLGMLHDIGRFEQLKIYGTFFDAESVDHAQLGADLLVGVIGNGLLRDYITEEDEDALIENAIRQHNVFRVSEELDERTRCFCDILRDADKIDILKANVDFSIEEIYNTTTEILHNEAVTDEVLQAFYEHHTILRSIMKTSVDHIVGHCSLVFELVFPESLKIVKEQKYIWTHLNFTSDNPDTTEKFAGMKKEMESYLGE